MGVAFYLLIALRAELRKQQWFELQQIPEPNLSQWLDLVALGTVADVVPLDQVNRALVHQGLLRIRAGHSRPGIQALLRIAGKNPARLVATDLGFALGPRLNAAGRLDDISLGIQCLLCDDHQQALHTAQELDELNQDRKSIETGMQQQALALATQQRARRNTRRIQAALARIDSGRFGLCPDCDQAVETARLHADPCTLFCMDCAEERDDQAAAEARQRLMRGPRG